MALSSCEGFFSSPQQSYNVDAANLFTDEETEHKKAKGLYQAHPHIQPEPR